MIVAIDMVRKIQMGFVRVLSHMKVNGIESKVLIIDEPKSNRFAI